MPENPKYTPKFNLDAYNPESKESTPNYLSGEQASSFHPGATDFGKSGYDDPSNTSNADLDNGDYKYIRGEKQNGLAQVGLGVLRAVSKAGVEAVKTPGYLYGLGEWYTRNVAGQDYTLDKALDNAYINALEDADDWIKEDLMPVHQSYKAGKGSFIDQVLTTSFVGREVADGVGYLLGMMAPGALISKAGLAVKLSKMGLGANGAALGAAGKASKLASNVELGTQTLINSSVEALAEAKGVSDRLKQQFDDILNPMSPNYNPINPDTNQEWTEEEKATAIADATKDTFTANMGVLLIPNLIMNKALLGRFSADKSALAAFRDPATKLLVDNPIARKSLGLQIAKAAGIGIISEGFFEEGGQSSIENYEVAKAMGKTDKGFIEGVASEYINTLSTTEGRKAILLGAILGGVANSYGAYKQDKANKAMYPAISQMIKNNFSTVTNDIDIFEREDDGSIKRNDRNQIVYNEPNIVKASTALVRESEDSQIKDLSLVANAKTLHDYLHNNQFTRFASSFVKQGELGIEILNEHIDRISESRIGNDTQTFGKEVGAFDENKYKSELKAKVKELQKVYDITQATISTIPALQSLSQIDTSPNKTVSSEYINAVTEAAYQETSKQQFYVDKLKELNREEMSNLNRDPSVDLPHELAQRSIINRERAGLERALANSKEEYNKLFDPNEHQDAFKVFIEEKQQLADALSKAEPITKKEVVNDVPPNVQDISDIESIIPGTTKQSEPTIKDIERDTTVADLEVRRQKALENNPAEESEINTLYDAELAKLTGASIKHTTEAISSDQELVSQNLTTSLYDEEKDQYPVKDIVDAVEGAKSERSINARNNTVMMRLFNHMFNKDGFFKFLRNDEGFPDIENKSKLDIEEINRLKIGDKLTFNYVTLDAEALSKYSSQKAESLSKKGTDPSDFDNKHIGIYANGKLVGFVQQPHAISSITSNYETSERVRNGLILFRKKIVSKLDSGETVEETVTEKGAGNLYTKLDEKGNIDPIFNPFQQAREHDKLNGSLLFVYSDGEKLVLKGGLLTDKQREEVDNRLLEFGKYGEAGKVYQLVKDTSDKWSPIPVYPGRIDSSLAKVIADALLQFNNQSPANEIVATINKYIYASTKRQQADLFFRNDTEDGTIKVWVNGMPPVTLEEINNSTVKRNNFISNIIGKPQNIAIDNINDISEQEEMNKRGNLVTNVTKFKEEFFVQPYIGYSQSIMISSETKKIVETNDTVPTTNTLSDIPNVDLTNYNTDSPIDEAWSRTKDDTKLDRSQFKKWLTKRLPQLELSDVEFLSQIKTHVTDAFGMFSGMTIHLFEGAGSKTAYHEAFHGVFRNLLSTSKRNDVMRDAKGIYSEPTREDLISIQEGQKRKMTDDELRYLYYEEKLADSFSESAYDYNAKSTWAKLGRAISDFFNKIAEFFGILSKAPESAIEDLFNRINTGKMAKVDPNNVEGIKLTNREFESLRNEPAWSRDLNRILGPSKKMLITETIGNAFMAKFQSNLIEGKDERPLIVYQSILNKYKAVFKDPKASEGTKQIAARVIAHFDKFILESNKYLESRNVKVNEKISFNPDTKELLLNSEENGNIDLSTAITEDNVEDMSKIVDEVGLGSPSTKGFGEWTSISGLSSASVRIKMFLSSIPVLDQSGKPRVDEFGFNMYHDFSDMYYYIERNLIDKYTIEEQLETLMSLSINRPEMRQVVNMLGYEMINEKLVPNVPSNMSKEQLELVRNDFKTNFSKQQLVYTLVKFDTDSLTGAVSYRIMDANRQTVGSEVSREWTDNVSDLTRNTIAEHKDGESVIFGTKAAIELAERWKILVDRRTPVPYKVANEILSKVGIEYSPEVLEALVTKNSNLFKNKVSTVLEYYATPAPTDVQEKNARRTMFDLVSYETDARFDRHTSSFNNGENKNIYTIQLPSYASKLLAKLRNPLTRTNAIKERQRDPFYKYNNILNEMGSTSYADSFKMSYLDSLKDEKGDSIGSKFTSMTPKDFLSMQIALFQNNAVNAQRQNAMPTSKHMYIIASDKTMAMMFDVRRYNVTLSEDGNHIDSDIRRSPIVDNFYNIFLSEAHRIKHNLMIKDDIIGNRGKGKYKLSDLMEHYHVRSKANDKEETAGLAGPWERMSQYIAREDSLTDSDWEVIETLFNGQAYKFNYFDESFHNKIFAELAPIIRNATIENLRDTLEEYKVGVTDMIANQLTSEYKDVLKESAAKGVITFNEETGLYSSKTLQLRNTKPELVSQEIKQLMADYSLNSMLHNIELSNLLNGDFATYKPNDLQKRTYQSQSMTTLNRFMQRFIKTRVVKDVEFDAYDKNIIDALVKQGFSDTEITTIFPKKKYGETNVTDAQVYVTPEFYKAIHESRGTWSQEMQDAYDVIEGIKDIKSLDPKQREAIKTVLGGIKPYYFGDRFDEALGIQRYEQVKCAMIPLFKAYTDMNPLMAEKVAEMRRDGIDMLAHESSFKAAIGYRTDITESNGNILNLDPNNFGIQVDNPNHIDDGNDSMRQLKMLIIGSIDPEKSYKGMSGKDIVSTIMTMEASNIRDSFRNLKAKMDIKNNANFTTFIKDMVTKRGATINVEEALNIIDGDFEYALDNGNLSTQLENMISSIFTNNVIKQLFEVGGSAVQATSLGLDYKNLTEQQDNLSNDAKEIQGRLQWIKPNSETGDIGYAECVMPAYSKKFFNKDGTLKDVNNIPEELRQLVAYRIPTEGLHSMMPIKVVGFLPETMGNFILLPYEVTTQFGADFDFDKIFFIGREFYQSNTDGSLVEYKYTTDRSEEATRERWRQYSRYHLDHKKENAYQVKTYEEFLELPIEEQNVRAARNNEIINMYLHILTSIENLHLMVTPSGFAALEQFKKKYFENRRQDRVKPNFFSSRTQRDYKERNHIGIALKGQSALHVSGHSYGVMMNLNTTRTDKKGGLDKNFTININGQSRSFFSGLYTDSKKLIADELSSIMAAILDDIKNPLLEPLGINNNTIDVLATIIRAGYDMNTALKFIAQPGIKQLSKMLNANKDKLKDRGQGWNTPKSLIDIYKKKINDLLEDSPNKENDLFVGNYVNFLNKIGREVGDTIMYDNLEESDLESVIKQYRSEEDMLANTKDVDEKIKFYSYQVRVLEQFANISKVSDQLVNVNKFLAINKEVGPNIEDIITKQELYDEIIESNIGFDIDKIPALKATWEVHKEALKWFEQYFPYSTETYMNIKRSLSTGQFGKKLSKIPVEDRMYMNNFIRTFTDYQSDVFRNVPNTHLDLLTNLPALLKNIKNASNKTKVVGNATYESIRTNSFIKELMVDFDKVNNKSFIRLKGNRLDLQVKNNIIDGFKSLFQRPDTRELAINLINHSFLTTGFYSGLNSYANLIGPDVLKELGYNEYRKELISKFKDNNVYLQENKGDIITQIVKNNRADFTKTFDGSIFIEFEVDAKGKPLPLPKQLTTSKKALQEASRERDMILDENKEDGTIITPKFISVYDVSRKQALIYENINPIFPFQYEYTARFGKKGKLIEVYVDGIPTESQLPENRFFTAEEERVNKRRKKVAPQLDDDSLSREAAEREAYEASLSEDNIDVSANFDESVAQNIDNIMDILGDADIKDPGQIELGDVDTDLPPDIDKC